MNWTPEQLDAIAKIYDWYQDKPKPWFYLAGYAGTGKTSLAREIADQIGGNVLFATFTGKAAHVLRTKGCPTATTIHSLIYQPYERSRERLRLLMREFDTLDDYPGEQERLQKKIEAERKRLKEPAFDLNPDSSITEADLIIIDEVSMVDDRTGRDLLSFGRPILVLGDPGQLKPVFGLGHFTKEDPDILLTEIHRQALDNPIIGLATRAREGKAILSGDYGKAKVVSGKVKKTEIAKYEQALCWKNSTRRSLNHRLRMLRGIDDPLPTMGDRLVCLRNNHDRGLLNGAIWTVIDEPHEGEFLHIWMQDDEGRTEFVQCHKQPFLGEEIPHWDIKEAESFDFGYCLTCHKSQGSEYDSVVVFDESSGMKSKKERAQWLYTAFTRAKERLLVIR